MERPLWSPASSTEPAAQGYAAALPERTPTVTMENRDPEQVIAELRSGGDLDLSTTLQGIVEAARVLTGASGAAIAMRHEGAVTCLARSGETAPDLGVRLNVDSGISGECLRTGEALRCGDAYRDPRVDVEVCRRLHLRSLAVVPLCAEEGVIGILEAFSDRPFSFPDRHLEVLQRLAELAVAARLRCAEAQYGNARATPAAGLPIALQAVWAGTKTVLAGAKDVLARFLLTVREHISEHRRQAITIPAGVMVLAVAFWLAFHGHRRQGQPGPVSPPAASAAAASIPAQSSPVSSTASPVDFVFQGTAAGTMTNKPSPASAKAGLKSPPVDVAEDLVLRTAKTHPRSSTSLTSSSAETATVTVSPTSTTSQPADGQSPEGPPLVATVPGSSPNPLGTVLSISPALPTAAVPVSQGISQGVIEHRVHPAYPPQARSLRLEGRVVLRATVAEDGTVHDVKIVSGHPMLARAAVDAVNQWRYRPYQLNGKPIAMQTEIKIDFKLP